MKERGVAFGSHGMTHRTLTGLPSETVMQEVGQSRDRLESILNEEICSFAYPDGKFSASTSQAVKAAGYKVAFTTERGPVEPGSDPYRVRRINIHEDMTSTIPMFLCRILGIL